jgi:hypothetical protein
MSHRSTVFAALAILATSFLSVSCSKPMGKLTIAPQQLHLREGGPNGEFVLTESGYYGYYKKTLDYDPHCATSVSATPRPRHLGDPAHLIIMPKRAGTCDVWLFDDHSGREKVTVSVDR